MKRLAFVTILAVFLMSGYASAATTGVWRINQMGDVTLTQEGTTITGTYYGYAGRGQISGTLEGNILTAWLNDPDKTQTSMCGPGQAWDGLLLLKFSADGRTATGDAGSCSNTHAQLSATSGYRGGPLQSGSPILFGQVDPGPVTGSGPAIGISANSTTELLSISQNTPLSIVIGLDQNNFAGINADWWLVLLDAGTGELYHYRFDGSWKDGLIMSYQGPISDLPDFEALNATLYPGTYYFYFGVDTIANGQLDMDHLYFTFVQVNVQ